MLRLIVGADTIRPIKRARSARAVNNRPYDNYSYLRKSRFDGFIIPHQPQKVHRRLLGGVVYTFSFITLMSLG